MHVIIIIKFSFWQFYVEKDFDTLQKKNIELQFWNERAKNFWEWHDAEIPHMAVEEY